MQQLEKLNTEVSLQTQIPATWNNVQIFLSAFFFETKFLFLSNDSSIGLGLEMSVCRAAGGSTTLIHSQYWNSKKKNLQTFMVPIVDKSHSLWRLFA